MVCVILCTSLQPVGWSYDHVIPLDLSTVIPLKVHIVGIAKIWYTVKHYSGVSQYGAEPCTTVEYHSMVQNHALQWSITVWCRTMHYSGVSHYFLVKVKKKSKMRTWFTKMLQTDMHMLRIWKDTSGGREVNLLAVKMLLSCTYVRAYFSSVLPYNRIHSTLHICQELRFCSIPSQTIETYIRTYMHT
jgi:uncharacterized membrane protein YecN with MAPEG domain